MVDPAAAGRSGRGQGADRRTNLFIAAATAGALALGGVAVAAPASAGAEGTGRSAVERITEALSGLVSDGSLTQEQAAEVASTLGEAGIGDRGGHGRGGRLDLRAAATALSTTEDELRSALEAEGTGLADVARERGVEVGALVAAVQEDTAQAVEDGALTQEAADD